MLLQDEEKGGSALVTAPLLFCHLVITLSPAQNMCFGHLPISLSCLLSNVDHVYVEMFFYIRPYFHYAPNHKCTQVLVPFIKLSTKV